MMGSTYIHELLCSTLLYSIEVTCRLACLSLGFLELVIVLLTCHIDSLLRSPRFGGARTYILDDLR